MKRSFLALLPGLSGLGTSVITEGKSDVFRSWGLAASGLKLGGLEGLWLGRMECHKGMPAKGVLKKAVSVCVFLLWITRIREAGLRLRLSLALQKRHLPSSWSPSVFSHLSWFLCNLLPLWEQLGNFSLLPKRRAADTAPGCQTLLPAVWGRGLVGLGSVGFVVDLMILKLLSNLNYSVILWFSCLSVKISFTGGQRGLCSLWGLLWGSSTVAPSVNVSYKVSVF